MIQDTPVTEVPTPAKPDTGEQQEVKIKDDDDVNNEQEGEQECKFADTTLNAQEKEAII